MKQSLIQFADRFAPQLSHRLRAIRNQYYFRRGYLPHFQEIATATRAALFPNGQPITVQTGPFKGMKFGEEITWSSITPKWLGSYESELHDVIEEIVMLDFRRVLNFGAGDGYYSVGLARRLTRAEITTFDTSRSSQKELRRLAEMNQVANRIHIHDLGTVAAFENPPAAPTLVVCDIEGFEMQLLDPALAPGLRYHHQLVEVHETDPNSSTNEDILCARFAQTHDIVSVQRDTRDRWVQTHPEIQLIPELLAQATDEFRDGKQMWLWMKPRHSLSA